MYEHASFMPACGTNTLAPNDNHNKMATAKNTNTKCSTKKDQCMNRIDNEVHKFTVEGCTATWVACTKHIYTITLQIQD